MKIIVVSDTHGNCGSLEKIVLIHRNTADLFIHLGDGASDVRTLLLRNPELSEKFASIRGNCDFSREDNTSVFIKEIGGHKLFAVHGHNHYVRDQTDFIRKSAESCGCNIILFGHTHKRYNIFNSGMYFFNPGSAAFPRDGLKPSYGVIDITAEGVLMGHGNA